MATARYGLDNPKKAELIDWLTDPLNRLGATQVTSQRKWAEAHNVHPGTVTKWMQAPEFRRAWEKRLAQLNVNPGRIQEVVDALHDEATKGNVQAGKLYLDYVSRFQPPPEQVESERPAAELTDAELEALLSNAAAAELDRRAEDRGE